MILVVAFHEHHGVSYPVQVTSFYRHVWTVHAPKNALYKINWHVLLVFLCGCSDNRGCCHLMAIMRMTLTKKSRPIRVIIFKYVHPTSPTINQGHNSSMFHFHSIFSKNRTTFVTFRQVALCSKKVLAARVEIPHSNLNYMTSRVISWYLGKILDIIIQTYAFYKRKVFDVWYLLTLGSCILWKKSAFNL